MEITRFNQLIDAYGTNANCWPAEESDDAIKFLVGSADARQYVEDAGALDLMLALAPALTPSSQLVSKIHGFAQRPAPPSLPMLAGLISKIRNADASLWPFGPIWRPATGLAMAALLGVLAGSLNLPYFETDNSFADPAGEELAMLTLGPEYELEDTQ